MRCLKICLPPLLFALEPLLLSNTGKRSPIRKLASQAVHRDD